MLDKELQYYEFNGYRLHPGEAKLLKDGKQVALTQKCFELLRYLVENHGRTLNKKELLGAVWPETFVEDSTLTSHIYMLRKALNADGNAQSMLRTVPKKGYSFEVEVKEVYSEEDVAETKGIEYIATLAPVSWSRILHPPIFAGVLLLVLFAVAIGFFAGRGTRTHHINSIAVLPFQQINIEKEDKMGLGMADILINHLGRTGSVRVTPTAAIAHFADEEALNPYEIGKKLDVDAVLTASSQCEDGVARVTYQLYDVRTGRVLLSEMLQEKHDGIFPLQDRITNRIYERLSAELTDTRQTQPRIE